MVSPGAMNHIIVRLYVSQDTEICKLVDDSVKLSLVVKSLKHRITELSL